MSDRPASAPPPSATSQFTMLLGLAGYVSALVLLHGSGTGRVEAGIIAMLATALPMLGHELLWLRTCSDPATGLGRLGQKQINWPRILQKLAGLCGTLAVIAAAYWLFPEYHRSFYTPFWEACRIALPVLLALAVPYFIVVDLRMEAPGDGYQHAGHLILGQLDKVDWEVLRDYALGWLIKGFFLPLMFVYFSGNAAYLLKTPLAAAVDTFPAFVHYMGRLTVGIDLAFVSIGYVLTLRLTNSHIRSCNPLFWGWAVTLAMYVPFFSIIGRKYLDYNDGLGWLDMLGGWGPGVALWGSVIIAAKLLWAWANASFGIRFSNLTHRGIITNGPYRWTRHPSYLFKNISWWLLSVPFFTTEGAGEALRLSLLLLGINGIYLLRAKAEERHLSEDPAYVAYAMWIEQHGKLRWLGRVLPALRYSPPETAPAR
ncbi:MULTISPECIES: methyltransferase family protein [unclassified Leisingera]|uniref:methyltransferase family protein n=1 Tax=unclassified Leisingera TaxID=2614906 RepID=UPI00138E4B8E|nr:MULTISPECIES: isoprenylcysteine carboxylmethyltransferase family protein [unclassified Leisingera]